MEKNIYDDPSFFEEYSGMLRSKEGLAGAGEWAVLEKVLPEFQGKRVLDLGCGYGWHCIYAASQGASRVVGIDLSEKMLEEAKRRNSSGVIEYFQISIEDFDYPPLSFDIVISSLALHYIKDVENIFCRVNRTLVAGGTFVFTIEHPIFTAEGPQSWFYNSQGEALHWPVDNYFEEGYRNACFLGKEVVKYHHTLTTLFQGLLGAGFTIRNVIEPQPAQEMLSKVPEMKEELRRPMMLIVAATKD